MKYKNKYVLRMEDGRNEPIKDLEKASRIIFVDEERVGAEDITFGFSRWEPNMSFHKKHTHENAEEIMYILSGKVMGGVVDQEFEVVKGDTVWVPRGAVHWAYNPFDEPCEFVFLDTRASFRSAGYEIVE
jgi:uncharacterized RmlC-like cupin family protein